MADNVNPPQNIISLEDADKLYKDYGNNVVNLLENASTITGHKATRAIAFNYENLKAYIDYIDKKAAETGTPIKSLRVYLGKYPKDLKDDEISATKRPDAVTVFFNPSADFQQPDGSTVESSFAIVTDASGEKKAVPVGQLLDATASSEETQDSLAMNFGNPIPPPYDDSNDFPQ